MILKKQVKLNTQTNNDTRIKIKHQNSTSIYKKQSQQIEILNKSIDNLREQLKKLSSSATKVIQKKLKSTSLTIQNNSKFRPNFNPIYSSKKMQQLEQQKNKIFRQITQIKQLISEQKNQQQPKIKFQIQRKIIKLKEITKQVQDINQQKRYTRDQMESNKILISEYKQSTANKEYQDSIQSLDKLKKQKANKQKILYHLNNEEISLNLYFFQLKQKVHKKENIINDQGNIKVPFKQIQTLIKQINCIIQQRNKIQMDNDLKIIQFNQKIKQYQIKNCQLEKKVRNIKGDMMKKKLQERFYQTKLQKNHKSISHIQTREVQVQFSQSGKHAQIQKNITKNIVKPIFQLIKRNQYKIQLGNCQINQNSKSIKDPSLQSSLIQKITKIIFILSQQKIVGVKSIYQTKQGTLINGQILSIDQMQKNSQKDLIVKDVKQIQFPKNSKNISLKVHKFNGEIQNIGIQYYGATNKNLISTKNLKNIEVILQKDKQGSFKRIKGIILQLCEKSQRKRQKTQQNQQEYQSLFVTNNQSNFFKIKKSHSIDNIAKSENKKKLELKPLKRLTQNLDHRLLIRKKLV